jgi:uncharacterized membrane protein YhhN
MTIDPLSAPVIATVVSALACVALVAAENANRRIRRARYLAKPIASLAFVLVPITGGAIAGGLAPGDHATWIAAGLVLGALGDVLLLFRGAFLAGLVVFLLGHVAYVVAFALVVPMIDWPRLVTWQAMATIAAGATALAWLWPYLRSMKVPVILYVGVIVLMVIGAAAASAEAPWSSLRSSLVIAGATMFFASDLAVARDRFVDESFTNKLWGLPVYYGAQLLIGWSLLVP